MKTKSKTTPYIVHNIAAAVLLLTAQISLAGSATWLLSPQDSAWENANNWTSGGPPNGPSDIATFAQSSQTNVNISIPEEVNSIVFSSGAASFTLSIPALFGGATASQLIVSGTGVANNSSVLQTFGAFPDGQIIFNNTAAAASAYMHIGNVAVIPFPGNNGGETIFNDASSAAGASIGNGGSVYGAPSGQTIFNDTSTADHASIVNAGAGPSSFPGNPGQTSFNGTSTAANASIDNQPSNGGGSGGQTILNDTSTAGHATITNEGGIPLTFPPGGRTVFNDSSTADSAILVANGGVYAGGGGAIFFRGASTGGTAQVQVFDDGYLDISGHQSGVTVGSIEGSGNVFLGANNLTVGTNNIDTSFSGVISTDGQGGSLAKVGSGVLTLQANDCIADTVGLILVSGSIVKLDFTGSPDVIASLVVNGVPQPPGIYGGPMSGAPNILPEFAGSGTVSVGVGVDYDFNADGHPDYVLYNTSTHQTAIWYLNNSVYLSGGYGPTLPPGWVLVNVADFNGDSHPDYVLFNPSTRQTAIWYLNNNVYVGGGYGPSLPSGYVLSGVADFNGDGKPDYVLYNGRTHQTAIWYLNNNVYVGGAYGPTLPSGWQLAAVGDFNGDGEPDYMLFNPSTRQTAIWYLNNNVYVDGGYGPSLPSGYVLSGVADFNGDGKPDYVLYNGRTRQTAIWYLNNNVYVGGAYGPTLPVGWSLAAP